MQWTFGTIAILAKENDNFADWRRIRTRLFGAQSPGIYFGASSNDISPQPLANSTFHLQGLRSGEGSQLAHEDLSSKWGARTVSPPLHQLSLSARVRQAVEGTLFLADRVRGSPAASSLAVPPQLSTRLVSSGADSACTAHGSSLHRSRKYTVALVHLSRWLDDAVAFPLQSRCSSFASRRIEQDGELSVGTSASTGAYFYEFDG